MKQRKYFFAAFFLAALMGIYGGISFAQAPQEPAVMLAGHIFDNIPTSS